MTPSPVEVSVVIPCLNEAETIGACVRQAQEGIDALGGAGEIIVADNGSTDGSVEIAERLNARVVRVSRPGYGSALMGGIAAARGRYIIMGDADLSYDFRETPRFVQKLREGYELVQGCRLPGGSGIIEEGAMPLSHRLIGNPMFTWLARRWFGAKIHDIYCGLRGFTRELYDRLDQRCTGMEFATEMVIKASLRGEAVSEIPITLHRDGRKSRRPHLRTVKDGWRTLRFFLLCSPKWLFLSPGLLLILLGVIGYGVAMPGLTLGGLRFDAHTLLFATLFLLCGYQAVLFALFAKTFAIAEGLLPEDPRLTRFFRSVNLERGLLASSIGLMFGVALLLAAVNRWRLTGFGDLDYARTMRLVIPGATLSALSFQTMLSSFFVSMLGMKRQ
ncbi:MAG: glycosyltransferase family 2 protein [Phycisphaerales bacterium]